mgnify:CR=1 FL=1
MLDALARHLPELTVTGVAAGVHLLLCVPRLVDDQALAELAAQARIRVSPLSSFYVGLPHSRGLVIGYGRLHETAIEPAVRALAASVRPGLGC